MDTAFPKNMLIEEIQSYLLGGVFGFVAGFLVTRFLFRTRMRKKKISDVIEYAMIDKTVSQLNSMTVILNRLVSDIKNAADELTERIEFAQDMEPFIEPPRRTEAQKKQQELSSVK
jgi:hypothetical protein